MGDIFREVDEDLRHDRYLRLWRDYGNYVLVGLVGLVAATAVVVFWREYDARKRADEATSYLAATDLARAGVGAEAAKAFESLARDASSGYATLSRLQEAGLKARAGDAAAASILYRTIAADNGVDPALRDVALLQSVLVVIETEEPTGLAARLNPLTVETNPWRHAAFEMLAVLAHRTGDMGKATEYFLRLADDPATPPGIRARAAEMLAVLGG